MRNVDSDAFVMLCLVPRATSLKTVSPIGATMKSLSGAHLVWEKMTLRACIKNNFRSGRSLTEPFRNLYFYEPLVIWCS